MRGKKMIILISIILWISIYLYLKILRLKANYLGKISTLNQIIAQQNNELEKLQKRINEYNINIDVEI